MPCSLSSSTSSIDDGGGDDASSFCCCCCFADLLPSAAATAEEVELELKVLEELPLLLTPPAPFSCQGLGGAHSASDSADRATEDDAPMPLLVPPFPTG